MEMEKMVKFLMTVAILLTVTGVAYAETKDAPNDEVKVTEIGSEQPQEQAQLQTQQQPPAEAAVASQKQTLSGSSTMKKSEYDDPLRYTLGPDDVVEITVMRHPEFSGVYPINLEGKIQYKFVGDLEVSGLTKKELEERIAKIISSYVINPDVNVTILEYKSKVIYVLGEVGQPGKYYMRADVVPIREAVVNAGLPTVSAAMRRSQLITPDNGGKVKTKVVDLYSILYLGDLKNNVEMKPGDVLHVPATVMAKVIRVISPVTSTVGTAASGPSGAQSGRTAVTELAR